MPSDENLYETLRAEEIDSAELSEIAFWHFHSARDISQTEVVFGGVDDHTYSLKFVYKKEKHRVNQILAGPSLQPEDIRELKAKIDLELQPTADFKVAGQILFTNVPVTGWYRYRDIFQITPMPEGAPQPGASGLFGGHPFTVQFQYRPCRSFPMLNGSRIMAQGGRIHLLLAGLLSFRVSDVNNSHFHWVVTGIDPLRTEYRQEMYDFPIVVPGIQTRQ